MPQVDVEAFVSVFRNGSSGRKIACEPLDDVPQNATETPPESFFLSKHAEFNRNAILERKESTKPKGANNNHSISSSGRFLKSKTAIIGLPKTQKNNFCDKPRCKLTNVRLFPPKRSESIAQMNEPSSPKVSCLGTVRSKRSRRCRRDKRPAKSEQKTKNEFCLNFWSLCRLDCRDGSVVTTEESSKNASKSSENVSVRNEAVIEAPGLGGMTQFASCRRKYATNEGAGAGASMTLRRCGSTRRN